MPDKYASFAALHASETQAAYAIKIRDVGTPIVIVAPHGGAIEPGTSEVAMAIAGDQHSYYLFEGTKVRHNRRDLHITSVHFDEPTCLALVHSAQIVLTIHGEESLSEVVYTGGLHAPLVAAIRAALEPAGFQARAHANVALGGCDQRNICNKGQRGIGVQLELSRGLRKSFFLSLSQGGRKAPTQRLLQFAGLIRQALQSVKT